MEEKIKKCSVSKKCGSCQYQGGPYKKRQLVSTEENEQTPEEIWKCKTNYRHGGSFLL